MVPSDSECICLCTCRSSRSITRADLVNNFPVSFTSAAFRSHFSSEYFKVVGHHAEAVVIDTLMKTFKLMWKTVRGKENLLSKARGKEWLQTKLTIKEPAPEIPELETATSCYCSVNTILQ